LVVLVSGEATAGVLLDHAVLIHEEIIKKDRKRQTNITPCTAYSARVFIQVVFAGSDR
jgi:hypothetical protein